ncbi:acetyltransferase [Moraxella osloensis]|nr:acetyltransferase [Moraxella osloensis]MBL7667624.1 acetyltransferase [Moraxella osloensis]
MSQLIGIYGASGFGKEVMPLVRQHYSQLNQDNIVFIDDGGRLEQLDGYKVLSYQQFMNHTATQKAVTIAIADSQVREKLNAKLVQDNIEIINVIANNALQYDNITMGKGSIICGFVHLTSNIKIGKGFHANIYSYIAHDCVIGDFVTFAPRVSCNGNVHIEDHAYIGTGAVLRQGTPDKPLIIGKGAIVGMGAVVTKDVPAGTTVVGNPARPLIKN